MSTYLERNNNCYTGWGGCFLRSFTPPDDTELTNHFLELWRDDSLYIILKARVYIYYNSATVPVAFINLTNLSIVRQKHKVLADEMRARLVWNESAINKTAPSLTSQIATASAIATMTPAQRLTPIEQAMANAEASLSFKQKLQSARRRASRFATRMEALSFGYLARVSF